MGNRAAGQIEILRGDRARREQRRAAAATPPRPLGVTGAPRQSVFERISEQLLEGLSERYGLASRPGAGRTWPPTGERG